ncbi:MAG: MazG nucleotide pyrophosphohydrolase domain-containing protein [Chloroflexota bacterium]
MSRMNFQTLVDSFVKEYQLETSVEIRLLDLQSELGELAKEALKGNQYGKSKFTTTPNWEEELADAFFSLVCIANSTGVNLDTALEKALGKYRTRIEERGKADSGR